MRSMPVCGEKKWVSPLVHTHTFFSDVQSTERCVIRRLFPIVSVVRCEGRLGSSSGVTEQWLASSPRSCAVTADVFFTNRCVRVPSLCVSVEWVVSRFAALLGIGRASVSWAG